MADRSNIEWTDASWTPIRARNLQSGKVGWHREHATPGCERCYSEGMNRRLGTGLPFKPGHRKDVEIFLDENMLLQPLKWQRPRMVFVCSMTDLFADFVTDEMIDRVFGVMVVANWHRFQVLTKRSDRMRAYMTAPWRAALIASAANKVIGERLDARNVVISNGLLPLRNVWLGVSAEDQRRADERIPDLLATPAAVRWVSAEPLLGPIDFQSTLGGTQWIGGQRGCTGTHSHPGRAGDTIHGVQHDRNPTRLHHHHDERCGRGIDWIVVGGESGAGARPMHPDWARSIRDQCQAAGVAYFHKQNGEWIHRDHVNVSRDHGAFNPDGSFTNGLSWPVARDMLRTHVVMERVGKKVAGRLLDGVEHNDMPVVRA